MNNQKGFAILAAAIALVAILCIALAGWLVYGNQLNSKPPTAAQGSIDKSNVQECVSKPVSGQVIFDVAQPAPFTDSRVNEIEKSINAIHLTWRDGSIIKIDGKDYSSGKYVASVDKGSEESAVKILKNNPHVIFASNMSVCPAQTQVKVE